MVQPVFVFLGDSQFPFHRRIATDISVHNPLFFFARSTLFPQAVYIVNVRDELIGKHTLGLDAYIFYCPPTPGQSTGIVSGPGQGMRT